MIGILFDGENLDLELEEEEAIELAGEVGSSTNPVYSSSEEEVEEPRRKRRRRGRENTESSSVRERSDSSESDGTDTNSISNLFAEDSSDEAFEGFPNCSLQWREPVGEINPPPAGEEPTGPKAELLGEASAVDFFNCFSTWTSLSTLSVKPTGSLNKAKLKQVKEPHFGLTL